MLAVSEQPPLVDSAVVEAADQDRCNVAHEIDRSVYVADVNCAKLVYRRNRRIACCLWNTDIRESIFVFVIGLGGAQRPAHAAWWSVTSRGPRSICRGRERARDDTVSAQDARLRNAIAMPGRPRAWARLGTPAQHPC